MWRILLIVKNAIVELLSEHGYPALDMHVYTFGTANGGPVCTVPFA